MSFVRLEDLFVAVIFAVVAGVSGWALFDGDDATPLVSSTTVVMDRGFPADELEPAFPPREIQVATHPGPVCPCCAGRLESRIAHTADVTRARPVLPPRPTFLN